MSQLSEDGAGSSDEDLMVIVTPSLL